MTRRTPRRALAAATLASGLALMLVAWPSLAQEEEGGGEEVRTEAPEFGGYTTGVEGAPLGVRFFAIGAIPTNPGQPEFEGTTSHTSAVLNTGPQARALASSVWPGAAFGDGFPTICECDEQWFARAEATYPGNEEERQEVEGVGAGMHVVARGLDVRAEADSSDSPNPEGFAADQVRSISTATVRDGRVIATLDSSVEGAALGGGVVSFDSVRTVLEATSDAATGGTSGQTVVSGLRINGYGYTIDQEGLHPVEEGERGEQVVPLPGGPPEGEEELRDQLGIEISLAPHEETVEGAQASRRAGGLIIRLTTATLKSHLEPVPTGEIIRQLPGEFRGRLYQFLSLAPTIEYVIARGSVSAAGAPPFEFIPPADPPPIVAAPPPASTTDPTTDPTTAPPPPTTSGSRTAPGPSFGSVSAPEAPVEEPPPQVADVPAEPVLAAPTSVMPEFFGGVPAGVFLLGMGLVGLGAYGLNGLVPLAFAGAGTAGQCAHGAPVGAPDLRGGSGG